MARPLLSARTLLLPSTALPLDTSPLSPLWSSNPMARSLTVKHEEKLGTSSLLNAFLFLAFAWMAGGALLASMNEAAAAGPDLTAAP